MPTCRLVTLGCKVNQYETQTVREALYNHGFREARDNENAHLCFVNTCTVTGQGDAKSRKVIRGLARSNPGTRIIVTGCYATRDPDAIRTLPGVTEVVTDKRELPDVLERFGITDLPKGIRFFDGRHRAFVKVQDGCLLDCSFCIIPQVRPRVTSRPVDDILHEVQQLVQNGYREIVLTGIHLGHFGVDLSRGKPRKLWCRLWHLLERLCKCPIPIPWRIRLSSLEATEVTDDFIKVLRDYTSICPHLHLSLQSGSDRILTAMRRRYRIGTYLKKVDQINQIMDRPAMTTDIIVGFPGESENDFQQTCHVVKQIGFSKTHLFPFSPRRGTDAALLKDQIPKPIKTERMRRLQQIEIATSSQYFQSLLGTTLEVLVEQESPLKRQLGRRESEPEANAGPKQALLRGTACRYAPVQFVGETGTLGQIQKVRVSKLVNGTLMGTLTHR